MNVLPTQRLLELCDEYNRSIGKKISPFCQLLCREFGISIAEIDQTPLDPGCHEEGSAEEFKKKLVKAGMSAFRIAIAQVAVEKGLVKLCERLPAIGKWAEPLYNDRNVLKIGSTGYIIIQARPGKGNSSNIDPTSNPEMIAQLGD